MRAGCFAEPRVIQLLNRRFVSFYYNTDAGPPQPQYAGKDSAAKKFVATKTKNKWAFYAAFNAQGEPLGVTDIYANKDTVFDFLVALLKANPQYNRFTPQEQALLEKAKAEPSNAEAQLEAGRLLEDLGDYDQARPFFDKIVNLRAASRATADAFRGLLRLARFGRHWERLEKLCQTIERRSDAQSLELGADLAAERGYRLRAQKQYGEMLKNAELAIGRHPQSQRMSELRFQAGVASYFLQEKDRASYHWCWVVENLPDDHLNRRCYLAAAHEGMPYKNPELDNYAAPLHGGQIEVIQAAYDRARETYEKLKSRPDSTLP